MNIEFPEYENNVKLEEFNFQEVLSDTLQCFSQRQYTESLKKQIINALNNIFHTYLWKNELEYLFDEIKFVIEERENTAYIQPLNLFTGIVLLGIELPFEKIEEKQTTWKGKDGMYIFESNYVIYQPCCVIFMKI